MSHSITINIQHTKYYLEICDSIINFINEEKIRMQNTNYADQFNFDTLLDDVNNLKKDIRSYEGQVIEYEKSLEIQNKLSTLSKQASNIKTIIQNQHNELVNEILKENEFDFQQQVLKYGTMAYDTIELLRDQGININKDNFETELNKIRQQVLNKEIISQYLTNAFKDIDECSLNDKIKVLLKQEVRNCKTSQEFSDVNALIQSKVIEEEKLNKIVKDVNIFFKTEGFKINKKNTPELGVDSYGNLFYKYRLVNAKNNTVAIIVNSSGDIQYKLGNYVGHMCNETTNKILNEMQKQGYKVDIKQIKRDIDNNKPLLMEAKILNK